MPYGRGGAGNFYQSEADKKRVAEDIEAALPPSSSSTSTSSQQAQEYAHMGRGGAGNWFSPRDLQQTGQFTSTDAAAALKTGLKSPASPTSPVSPPGLPPNYPGASATHTPIHTDAAQQQPQQQPQQQQLPTARLGRGGAGNMVWDDGQTMDERKRKEKEDEEKREVLSEKVKQDVEAGLKRPGRAVLGEHVGVNGVKGWKF